jgi:uncharacterized protein YbjT (DUF2867 family)
MKAIVIGATGLVGKSILKRLLEDQRITAVLIFTRRDPGFSNSKLTTHIVDFEQMADWAHEIRGDILFSALGTTLKTAGSKMAQYRIDHDYQLFVAEAAAQNEVSSYVLISSVNADSMSHFFYLKMKGELEEKVAKLAFKSISILRPGPLKGKREESRIGEVLGTFFLDLMPKVLVTPGVRPVQAERVAIIAAQKGMDSETGIHIIGPKEILGV